MSATERRSPMRNGSPTINALAWLEVHDGVVIDKSGFATRAIYTDLGIKMTAASNAIGKCRAEGWVVCETNGKRTYSIELTDVGRRFLTEYRDKVTYTNGNGHAPTETVGDGDASDTVEPPDAAPAPVAGEVAVPAEEDDLGPGRPGRAAARLEKAIPGLVRQGIVDFFGDVMLNMGIGERFEAQIASLREYIEQQDIQLAAARDELREARNDANLARRRYNEVLKDADKGKRDGNALKPGHLHESWRSLAAEWITRGGRVYFSRGSTIQWIAPSGARHYSPRVPVSPHDVDVCRADLAALPFVHEMAS